MAKPLPLFPEPLTRRAKHEAAKKARGLVRVAVWIPVELAAELRAEAAECCKRINAPAAFASDANEALRECLNVKITPVG